MRGSAPDAAMRTDVAALFPHCCHPASFPADGFHWQIWIIPRWNSEQCFREHDHQQLPDVGQLLVSYLQGLLLRIVYCGPALRAPPPPPFATHLYFFNGILELVFFIRLSMALLIRLSMALLIRLIMALFTRPKIGLFHPTLTPDDQERAGGASRVFLQGSK